MQARDPYHNRRGHAPQLSISDDNHHVTEAIGDMYGDNEYYAALQRHDPRPLSFVSSPLAETIGSNPNTGQNSRQPPPRLQPVRSHSNEKAPRPVNGSPQSPRAMSAREQAAFNLENGPVKSPTLQRSTSDTANQQFPLNDIDYESSPAAVAQELSNLQAIRRMSMDVNNSDPDLPSFSSKFAVPPSPTDEDDDASQMFWVPASLHPELAPKEFKTFIEDKVERIRRRSGGEDSLSPEGSGLGGGGSLRRKKSMLSRQIDSPVGYRDGADRLEKKKSLSGSNGNQTGTNLQELEHIVNDPSTLVRKLSIESARRSVETGTEVRGPEDMPILPVKPLGQSLKRSTRTTYRRGSLRKGERVPLSKRVAAKYGETDTDDSHSPQVSPVNATAPDVPQLPQLGIHRVQTEPAPPHAHPPENFSRPYRKRSPIPSASSSTDDLLHRRRSPEPTEQERRGSAPEPEHRQPPQPQPFHSRIASRGRTTAALPGPNAPVPQIIETPPPPSSSRPPQIPMPAALQQSAPHTQRKSSHDPPHSKPPQAPLPRGPPPPPSARQQRQGPLSRPPGVKPSSQTLDEMAQSPSPLPGNSTRTDSLSFIPTFADDKKADKKSKEKKEAPESGTRKTSWGGWFSSSEEKEREKKEKEDKEAKKARKTLTKQPDKSHVDSTRLDVLQTSIDGGKGGRESVVLDRESIKLEEERKKESRKASAGERKDKEGGILSSIFGGGKKKTDRDSGGKKASSQRGLSPEPPPRILKPDVDYNWTRFSILEERAIYRMAHLKLANPRRELYSQVLLSNFMYSYLAKVQSMHPQMQIPQSALQKQQQRQAAQQKKDQPDEFTQYQRYQEQQARNIANHEASNVPSEDQISEQDVQDEPLTRQESRSSQQSQHSQHSQHPPPKDQPQGHPNGYKVSTGRDYLGQQRGRGNNKPLYSFDDDSSSKDGDSMW